MEIIANSDMDSGWMVKDRPLPQVPITTEPDAVSLKTTDGPAGLRRGIVGMWVLMAVRSRRVEYGNSASLLQLRMMGNGMMQGTGSLGNVFCCAGWWIRELLLARQYTREGRMSSQSQLWMSKWCLVWLMIMNNDSIVSTYECVVCIRWSCRSRQVTQPSRKWWISPEIYVHMNSTWSVNTILHAFITSQHPFSLFYHHLMYLLGAIDEVDGHSLRTIVDRSHRTSRKRFSLNVRERGWKKRPPRLSNMAYYRSCCTIKILTNSMEGAHQTELMLLTLVSHKTDWLHWLASKQAFDC